MRAYNHIQKPFIKYFCEISVMEEFFMKIKRKPYKHIQLNKQAGIPAWKPKKRKKKKRSAISKNHSRISFF